MMPSPFSQWRILPDATNEEIAAILAQDPVWHCFALADLYPPWRTYSQFALAIQETGNASACCLIVRHPIIGQVLSPSGNDEGVAALLHTLTLPDHPLVQVQERHLPLLQQVYRPVTGWRKMYRMAVAATSWHAPSSLTAHAVTRLTLTDLPALHHLYHQHPESGFSAELFLQGIYVGLSVGERLVAAGGTHVLVPSEGIAVLGNILTAPESRGQGYATAITAALVTTLCQQQYKLIVLNVFADNSSAFRLYQRLGFQTHYTLCTGKVSLVR